jgi:hypothetical protein
VEEAMISMLREGHTNLFCVNCLPIILSNMHRVEAQEFVPQGQTELTSLCTCFTISVEDMQ